MLTASSVRDILKKAREHMYVCSLLEARAQAAAGKRILLLPPGSPQHTGQKWSLIQMPLKFFQECPDGKAEVWQKFENGILQKKR